MKYSKEFKKYMFDLVAYCKHVTCGWEYQVNIFFSETDCEQDMSERKVAASIGVDTAYLYANINIFPSLYDYWVDQEYQELGRHILHELCHILTEPIKEYPEVLGLFSARDIDNITDINERQTQRIRNCIIQQLPAGWSNPDSLKKWRNSQ